jgi:hypothetical protein
MLTGEHAYTVPPALDVASAGGTVYVVGSKIDPTMPVTVAAKQGSTNTSRGQTGAFVCRAPLASTAQKAGLRATRVHTLPRAVLLDAHTLEQAVSLEACLTCVTCMRGKFKASSGNEACTPCPAGTGGSASSLRVVA